MVFSIVRDSMCSECGEELGKGCFLRMEQGQPFCLACADLDQLVFLPRGDTALTRRAKKYSTLWAAVVRFSRSRNRYERQGLLVEAVALTRAEQECLSDAGAREQARARAAERRSTVDLQYVEQFAHRISDLFPRCPSAEQQEIAEHACEKYSGRVGRSAAAKAFDGEAIELAVRAHIRHRHTKYDEWLAHGHDRHDARQMVVGDVDAVARRWQGPGRSFES